MVKSFDCQFTLMIFQGQNGIICYSALTWFLSRIRRCVKGARIRGRSFYPLHFGEFVIIRDLPDWSCLQNRCTTGQAYDPSPSTFRSTFSWYLSSPDRASWTVRRRSERSSSSWWLSAADGWSSQWNSLYYTDIGITRLIPIKKLCRYFRRTL